MSLSLRRVCRGTSPPIWLPRSHPLPSTSTTATLPDQGYLSPRHLPSLSQTPQPAAAGHSGSTEPTSSTFVTVTATSRAAAGGVHRHVVGVVRPLRPQASRSQASFSNSSTPPSIVKSCRIRSAQRPDNGVIRQHRSAMIGRHRVSAVLSIGDRRVLGEGRRNERGLQGTARERRWLFGLSMI